MKQAAVIRLVAETGETLLLKRHPHDRNKAGWCLPGGKLEENEFAPHGVLRELHEETGILLLVSQTKEIGTYETDIKGIPCIVYVFEAKLPAMVMVEISDEHEDWSWFTPMAIEAAQSEGKLAGKTYQAIKL